MPISSRIPAHTEELFVQFAKKKGKTKTAVILEAVDEKLGFHKNKQQLIRDLAGWMSHNDAEELRNSLHPFAQINEGDWE